MIVLRKFALALTLLLLTCLSGQTLYAQGAAMSKDYWVSYLPSKRQSAPIWLLACTNVPNTTVQIIYTSEPQFNETFTISPNFPREYKIVNDNGFLAKPTVPEQIQNRTVHVIASNPISLQGFTDDDNNVGLFLVLPTASLGQNYVIAAYNDQPYIAGNCYTCFDSSSGGFVVTAVEDNTNVTIKANSPTKGGHATGDIWSVTLNQGENYWVQGAAQSDQDDLSGSRVTSNKPVAVIAGCEIMRALDAMVIQGHFDYNDYIVEQMIPEEVWGTDYVSAPFTNKRGTALDKAGDLYRVFAWDPQTNITFNGRVQNPGNYWEFPLTTDPVHITSDKPIMVVQYDYYEDFHFAGEPRTSNTEMVLVPRHNWRRNATFKVPTGYALTYFAVAAPKDSIDNIQVQIGGQAPHSIGTMPPGLKYTVDNYAVRVIQIDAPVQAIVTGTCDFAVYNYGTRDNDAIKVTYGYAAAAAASFGSITNSHPPKMKMDSTCTTFDVTLIDSSDDGRGIGEIDLLNDPNGLVYRGIPYVSTNTKLTVDPFSLGDKTITAHVTVVNALLDAFAAVYVTNRAGKDTVYTFSYSGVKISTTPGEQFLREILYGSDSCANYVMTNTGKLPIPVKAVTLESKTLGKPSFFGLTTTPSLPVVLLPNQSINIKACYTGTDTEVVHLDSIQVVTDCYTANMAEIKGSAAVPLIYSVDLNFGNVVVGATKCQALTITDSSKTKDLIVTKNFLFNSNVFTLDPNDLKKLPITLKPLQSVTINVCYTPQNPGYDTSLAFWGSDIPSPYTHDIKDVSRLIGRAVSAGVNWNLNVASAATVCTADTIITLQLENTGTAQASIDSVVMQGPDAAEFTLQSIGTLTSNFTQFPVDAGASLPTLVRFVANTSGPNPWRVRHATLAVYTVLGPKHDTSFMDFTATVSHPQLALNQSTINFNEVNPGVAQTANVTVMNQGSSDMTIQSYSCSDTTFTVLSGISVGQVIPPGGSTIVTIQSLNAVAGKYSGTFDVSTQLCGGKGSTNLVASFISRSVQATGTHYDTTWTCESGIQNVEFCNTGSVPVLFKGAIISSSMFDTLPSMNAQMFQFGDQGQLGKLANDSTFFVVGSGYRVPPDSCISLQVLFNPTAAVSARGVVTFSYDTGDGNTQTLDRLLTANAKILPVEVTASNNTSQPYSQVIGQSFEVPITVKQDLSPGDIYGYDFNVKFNADMFAITDVKSGDMGYAITQNSGFVKSGDTNYVLLNIRASGANKIAAGQQVLARLELSARLTRQDSTTIVPSNLTFFRQDGSSICYTPTIHDPALYIQPLQCGDKTIQGYLQTGDAGIVHLIGNSPNPFSGQTEISFAVHANKTPVTIEVYDLLGSKVATLMTNQIFDEGTYSVHFDAGTVASGSYYCRIVGGAGTQVWTETSRLSISK